MKSFTARKVDFISMDEVQVAGGKMGLVLNWGRLLLIYKIRKFQKINRRTDGVMSRHLDG